MPKVRKELGFSVVEIVVVVAVILTLAAIAVTHMLRARMLANEASAVASIRAVQQAEEIYHMTYPDTGYSGSLANLGNHGSDCLPAGRTNACLIMDSGLAGGLKSGYIFDLLGDGQVPDASYTITAIPASANSGRCTFFFASELDPSLSGISGPGSSAGSASAGTGGASAGTGGAGAGAGGAAHAGAGGKSFVSSPSGSGSSISVSAATTGCEI